MRRTLRNLASLSAVAGALVIGQAQAAVKLSDAFDGNYFSPSESGRGISVDVVPHEDGSSTFFGALFSYDSDGNPHWLTLQGDFLENQFKTDVGVYETTGGTFGFPFTAPSTDQIGTATVTVNSCNSISFSLHMDAGSGFDDADLGELQPVGGSTKECVYTKKFTGCPGFASASQNFPRACVLNGVYKNMDMTLTNDTTWLLNGLVRWGDDNSGSSTLRIEPGTTIAGGGGSTDYIYISPGSKIFAEGTQYAPIVLTSENDGFIEGTTPLPGDLGGVVISGNAPANACPEAPFDCRSEFDQTQRFGGDKPHENSGTIRYFQIRYAGIEFQPDAEVNSWTFQAVGDGTTVDHIQAYQGTDDGVEFFGGTNDIKYFVVTQPGDDSVDHDLGFSGKIQYALVVQGNGFGENNGNESSNGPDNFDAQPRAIPIYANFTMIGDPNSTSGGDGMHLKEGTGGHWYNSIYKDFAVSCLSMNDLATYNAAGTPGNHSGNLIITGVILDCNQNFSDEEGAPYTAQAFFNSFPNNMTGNPMLSGYMPKPSSPALTGASDVTAVEGDFFDQTTYRGAFDGVHDWTKGWTYRPMGDGT